MSTTDESVSRPVRATNPPTAGERTDSIEFERVAGS